MKKVNANKIKFYEFLNDDIETEELEQWIYATKEFESVLPEDHYTD